MSESLGQGASHACSWTPTCPHSPLFSARLCTTSSCRGFRHLVKIQLSVQRKCRSKLQSWMRVGRGWALDGGRKGWPGGSPRGASSPFCLESLRPGARAPHSQLQACGECTWVPTCRRPQRHVLSPVLTAGAGGQAQPAPPVWGCGLLGMWALLGLTEKLSSPVSFTNSPS